MSRMDDYLRRAEAANELAAKCAPGSDSRRQFLEIAEQWRDRARQIQELRSKGDGPEPDEPGE